MSGLVKDRSLFVSVFLALICYFPLPVKNNKYQLRRLLIRAWLLNKNKSGLKRGSDEDHSLYVGQIDLVAEGSVRLVSISLSTHRTFCGIRCKVAGYLLSSAVSTFRTLRAGQVFYIQEMMCTARQLALDVCLCSHVSWPTCTKLDAPACCGWSPDTRFLETFRL